MTIEIRTADTDHGIAPGDRDAVTQRARRQENGQERQDEHEVGRERAHAAVAPKETAVALVKFVPVMTTVVPPLVLPESGLTVVTVGADAGSVIVKGMELTPGTPVSVAANV